jgi:hypothetical protein
MRAQYGLRGASSFVAGIGGWPLALDSQPFGEVPDDRHDSLQPWSPSSRHFTQSERLAWLATAT